MYKCLNILLNNSLIYSDRLPVKNKVTERLIREAESNHFPAGLGVQAGMTVNMLSSCHACCHTCWTEDFSCWKLVFLASVCQCHQYKNWKCTYVLLFKKYVTLANLNAVWVEQIQRRHRSWKPYAVLWLTLICRTKKLIRDVLVNFGPLDWKTRWKNKSRGEDPVSTGRLWNLRKHTTESWPNNILCNTTDIWQIQLCHARGG